MRAIAKIAAANRQFTGCALAAAYEASSRISMESAQLSHKKSDDYPSPYMRSRSAPFCDYLAEQCRAWERERQKASTIDVQALMAAQKVSGSSFALPRATEVVEPEPLDALKAETNAYRDRLSQLQKASGKRLPVSLPGNPPLFGIGPLRAARGANIFDSTPSALTPHVLDLSPGEGRLPFVMRGPYDLRACKYLFVIDQYGLHVLHELTPCKTTARGFGGHPQLPKVDGWAAIGGEVFFSDDDDRRVFVNFGSGRFPPDSVAQMEASARYWLACGMNEVVAVFSDRDLSTRPYGLGDRYGQQLPNKRYLRKVQIKDEAG